MLILYFRSPLDDLIVHLTPDQETMIVFVKEDQSAISDTGAGAENHHHQDQSKLDMNGWALISPFQDRNSGLWVSDFCCYSY
jgi:hypothetical protein